MDRLDMAVGLNGLRDQLVSRTQTMLSDGVPLTLLLDLADPAGPDSAGHFANETADLAWLRPRRAQA